MTGLEGARGGGACRALRWLLQACGCALVACSHVPSIEGDTPPRPNWQTDADRCSWHWQQGGGLGLWAETCQFSTGRWQVSWDDRLRAFVLQRDAMTVGLVVQPWTIAAGAGLEGLKRALIGAGHLESNADCRWKSVPIRPAPRTRAHFVLAPSSPDALKPTPQGEVPEPMCGPYGASTHGVRYFIVDLSRPDLAIFVDEGQERPLFDAGSITVLR